jgi:hypothetical protein
MTSRRWPMVAWWGLVAVDAAVVAVFAVTAAIEPYHILAGDNIEIENWQGVLSTAIVVVLRGAVLTAERYLLPVAGALVLAARLASVIGFAYGARWMYFREYSRWYEIVLGGTLVYALTGVAAIGLVAFVYVLNRAMRRRRPAPAPASAPPVETATPVRTAETAAVVAAAGPADRRTTRESLFSLVGVFLGVAGLIMGVDSLLRIAVAVVVAGLTVAAIALLLRNGSDR